MIKTIIRNCLFCFKKIKVDQFVIESDENMPSTPNYSDNMKNNICGDNEEFGPTKMRFLVVAIVSATFFLQVKIRGKFLLINSMDM